MNMSSVMLTPPPQSPAVHSAMAPQPQQLYNMTSVSPSPAVMYQPAPQQMSQPVSTQPGVDAEPKLLARKFVPAQRQRERKMCPDSPALLMSEVVCNCRSAVWTRSPAFSASVTATSPAISESSDFVRITALDADPVCRGMCTTCWAELHLQIRLLNHSRLHI